MFNITYKVNIFFWQRLKAIVTQSPSEPLLKTTNKTYFTLLRLGILLLPPIYAFEFIIHKLFLSDFQFNLSTIFFST